MSAEVLWTLASVAMVGAAQILFKLAARDATLDSVSWHTAASWLTASMIAALAVSTLATVIWVWVLRSATLSIVYPFYALTFVAVPLLDWALFGTMLSTRYWAGAAAVVGGVWLMSGGSG